MSITTKKRNAAQNECEAKLVEISTKLKADFEIAKQKGDKALMAFHGTITTARHASRDIAEEYGLELKKSFYDLFEEEMKAVQEAKRRVQGYDHAASLHEEIDRKLAAPLTLQRLLDAEGRLAILSTYETYVKEVGLDVSERKAEIERILKERLDHLWSTLDKDAVKELRLLISDQWYPISGDRYLIGTDVARTRKRIAELGLELNEEDALKWNDAVARHMEENLSVGDFIGLEPGLAADTVLRMAARAKNSKDLTKAQIVLAYCNQSQSASDAVGYLRQSLALMVDRAQHS